MILPKDESARCLGPFQDLFRQLPVKSQLLPFKCEISNHRLAVRVFCIDIHCEPFHKAHAQELAAIASAIKRQSVLTGGRGVDVVYDSVGKTTFEKGLNLLRPRGMMALFGGSSGAVAPLDPIVLTQKGSLFLTRPSLGNYIATAAELQQRAGAVFGMIAGGKLKLRIEHVYPLAEAQQAHRDLEGRKTMGKLLLIP